jgi:hypothetical protein
MDGAGAPDDMDKAHRTQVWLATSDEPAATPEGTSFARSSEIRTRPRRMSNGRICCSNCAAGFQARL